MEFIFIITLAFILHKLNFTKINAFVFLIFLIFCLTCANRSLLIPDTEPYWEIFSGYITGSYEKGFLFLCDFSRGIGFSFRTFLFFISLIGLSIWLFITKRIIDESKILLAFIVYCSYMGIYYHGIVLRAGLAVLINYIGIYYGLVKRKNYFIFYACVLFSMLFHISAVLFALVPIIVQKEYQAKTLYITLTVSFLFMFISDNVSYITNFLLYIIDNVELTGLGRLGGYIEKAEESTLSLTKIKYYLSGVVLIYLSNYIKRDYSKFEIFNIFKNIYILGLILLFLLSFAPGAARIAQLFLFFEFLPFILLCESIDNRKSKFLRFFLFVLVVTNILNLYRLVPALWNYCS